MEENENKEEYQPEADTPMAQQPGPKFYLETTSHAEEKAKKELKKYFKIIALPVLLAAVVQVCAFFVENTNLIIWLALIIIFIYLTFLLKYRYQASLKKVLTYLISVGCILGFIVALVKLILAYKFYLIFNLIAEPALFAAIGVLVGSLVYLLFKNKRKEVGNGRTKERNQNTRDGSKS